MKTLALGTVIMGDITLTKEEVNFYQLLADDYTIMDAAEMVFLSKRTCEDRMYKLKNKLSLKTIQGLVTYLVREKIIK